MSTVFTSVLPAYTTADPVTSTTATAVEQPLSKMLITMTEKNLIIKFLHLFITFLLGQYLLGLVDPSLLID